MMQIGFFNEEKRYDKLSELGDSLEELNAVIDWELFRPILNRGMKKVKKEHKGPNGRPPYAFVLLSKFLCWLGSSTFPTIRRSTRSMTG